MSEYVLASLLNGISVFVGLYVLWSILKVSTTKQRAVSALVAGVVSGIVTLLIYAFIIGPTG